MNPSDLYSALRRIAAAIDNSTNPSRELVARDLQSLVTRLANDQVSHSFEQQILNILQNDSNLKNLKPEEKDKLAEGLQEVERNPEHFIPDNLVKTSSYHLATLEDDLVWLTPTVTATLATLPGQFWHSLSASTKTQLLNALSEQLGYQVADPHQLMTVALPGVLGALAGIALTVIRPEWMYPRH
jgi:hypothetical protein